MLTLMDGLFAGDADRWTAEAAPWWNTFYADRAKDVPFFVAKPDENLVSYIERGLVTGGRALDLGCGPGRNAIYLAARGFDVDAVDLSPEAIGWARDRAGEAAGQDRSGGAAAQDRSRGAAGQDRSGEVGAEGGVRGEIRFHCGDAFDLARTELTGPYDLIYDSGCFHHLPPHRRVSYLALLEQSLALGGHFGLCCFAAGGMGSELSDADFYHQARLHGGIAYTPESLRWIFSDLTEVELRRMNDEPPDSPRFGEPFLWCALFRQRDVV